ncbi:hypothetical protein M446_4438 [Methylobacterium sp. 4-46]|uniref:hypothetical protein n=1 Tax=unclassified Methylobacterium TaxID=2615210 RepID=UPI000165CCD7|nr:MULTISPECIES: hypothetical protein [Methylobacterium]ACA18779.1 hypothetical protein M446_4438 [Methylobacterium sp. 4-46]WFT78009.1 hypothetical protein QA634_22270 [Methylobacterium nodulans]
MAETGNGSGRGAVRRWAAALACAVLAVPAARAQEGEAPLFLRIRPQSEIGAGGSADAQAQAAAARAAFEARITARANRAIASVCTGCLVPDAVVAGVFATGPN